MVPVTRKEFVFAVLLMLALSSIGMARLRYIPDNYPTIQSAIDDGGGGDTLIVRPGTYYENISFDGQNLVLASEFLLNGDYTAIEQTVIDGSDLGPVVTFAFGETNDALLCGFTIQHGVNEDGGGVFCDHASPTIAYNIIRDNLANRNTGGGNGGGIFCFYSTALIMNNLIMYNNTNGIYGGFGGGVAIRSANPILINNTITRNNSNQVGGGLFIVWSTPSIINTVIWNNAAVEEGNEIYVSECTPNITYCDIHSGYPGEGNRNSNPEFRDPDNDDFRLMAVEYGYPYDSPCIDTGDPNIFDHRLDRYWGLGTNASDIGAFGGSDSIGTGISDDLKALPALVSLAQNYPNPFNPSTTIQFTLDSPQYVMLKVFNPLGQELATLVNSPMAAGEHKLVFDASGYASGNYYYKLETAETVETRCMTIVK